MNSSEADDAGDELIAFWSWLKREYELKNADSIIAYLGQHQRPVSPQWMVDPNSRRDGQKLHDGRYAGRV